MPQYLHTENQTATSGEAQLSTLNEVMPSGAGYLERKADGSLVMSQPPCIGGTGGQKFFEEVLTITTDNVIPPLSFTPKYSVQDVWLTLGSGWVTHSVKEGGFTVNTATRTISLVAGAAYVVKAGWQATVRYATDDDISAPTITSVSPASVTVGETFTITGTGFTPNAVVTLGGQVVTAVWVSATELTVTIPALVFSGNSVIVQTVTGTANASGFNFTPPLPTLASFAPTTQIGGSTVVLTGTNFYGVSQVQFGGVNAASFVVNSPTQITATTGAGATGAVSVTTLYGTASLGGFTYILASPTISTFAPTLATAGTRLVITGMNFSNATAVRVNGANVFSFTIDSATQITAVIAKTQTTGTIEVVNPFGTGASASTLTVDQIFPFPRAGRAMTADTTVIAGRSYTTLAIPAPVNPAWWAFNFVVGSASWYLGADSTNQRLILRLPFKARLSSYRIQHQGYISRHFPRDWQFQGSNDGLSWTTLDTRTGIAAVNEATYTIPISEEFEYFSINVLSSNAWQVAISELTLDVTLF
jgi:hypothetical protein